MDRGDAENIQAQKEETERLQRERDEKLRREQEAALRRKQDAEARAKAAAAQADAKAKAEHAARVKAEEEARAKAQAEAEAARIRAAWTSGKLSSAGMPVGWEKRLDHTTGTYKFIDHNTGVVHTQLPQALFGSPGIKCPVEISTSSFVFPERKAMLICCC